MNNKKPHLLVAVYGDSLSMPRSFDGIGCDQLYCELLRHEGKAFGEMFNVVVFNRSQGAVRIKELFDRFTHDLTYIAEDQNKVLIIQCGIVDCAPRPVPFFIKNLIGKMPVRVRVRIIDFLHRNRCKIQKVFRFRATSAQEFRRVLKSWLTVAGPIFKNIYVVNIFPTTNEVAEHSPGFRESIVLYNQIIAEEIHKCEIKHVTLIDVCKEIALSAIPIVRFVSQKDGHHLTADGHELIKQLILGKI